MMQAHATSEGRNFMVMFELAVMDRSMAFKPQFIGALTDARGINHTRNELRHAISTFSDALAHMITISTASASIKI